MLPKNHLLIYGKAFVDRVKGDVIPAKAGINVFFMGSGFPFPVFTGTSFTGMTFKYII